MEHKQTIDEEAVWQRVNAASHGNAPDVPRFPAWESVLAEGAGLYQGIFRLARRTENRRLFTLAREQKKGNELLRGLYFLETGKIPNIPPEEIAGSGQTPPEQLRGLLLRQREHMKGLEGLERQAGEGSFGILEAMGCEAGKHCREMLEVLSQML